MILTIGGQAIGGPSIVRGAVVEGIGHLAGVTGTATMVDGVTSFDVCRLPSQNAE